MRFKKSVTLGAIFILLISASMAQEKRVIQIRRGALSDSIRTKVFVDHDFEMSDSVMKNVFIHKLPHHAKKAARIIIKKSGFFRKSKIVIDFDPFTKEILNVTENDKEIAQSKFHKYQDYLDDAADMEELEALHPRMEELEWVIEASDFPDSQKIADLETMILDLEMLGSDRAHLKRERYTSLKKVLELEHLEEVVQDILEGAGMTPPQKIETIAIKKGKFFVNGEEIKGDAGKKCLQAYMSHSDLNPEDMQKKGEEISIKIRFD